MRRLAGALGLVGAALLVLSCEEVTTQTKESTFVVRIDIEGSPFIANGDTLLGDVVQFVGAVTENGNQISTSGQRFTSSMPDVVLIDSLTGEAAFVGVGQSVVSVTYTEPQLAPPDTLAASMIVRVTEYVVELGLRSTFTGNPVDPDDALVGDVVVVEATVTKDGSAVPDSGITVISSNTDVARPVLDEDSLVAFVGPGPAELTVSLARPVAPGGPLTQTLDVTVTNLVVTIDAASLIDQSFMANGDTLVTDSVQFSAVVVEGGDTVSTTGPNWTSSDPSVIRIVDAGAGLAVFEDTGTVSVGVSFATPNLPGEPFTKTIRVTTYLIQVEVTSLVTGGALPDTLVTDSVTFSALTTSTKTGGVAPSSLSNTESSNSTVVNILVPIQGTAVFPDTGQATVTLTLDQPALPDSTLTTSLDLRVTTFLAEISQIDPDTTPSMGDSIQYSVEVTDTRDNSTVSSPDVTYTSSSPNVIAILNASTGSAFARDTGGSVVSVTVNDPSLPRGIIADALPPTVMTQEYFYGPFSDTAGDFGNTPSGDTIVIGRSAVHLFTDSTWIQFPNGAVAFVDSVTADALLFLVPAGADTGQLVMNNLVDDQGDPRDNVPTRIIFEGPGSDAIPDFYEDNDTLPLTTSVDISQALPFEVLLSSDPRKTAPADSNFFYFTVPAATWTLDILAEWQVNADIDFKVCNATGDPPTGYDPDLCPRPIGSNSTNPRREEETDLVLSTGRYVINFYCTTCPALPLTYKVTIEKQ